MYEHFRNDFQHAANEHGITRESLKEILGVLDKIASQYEIHKKETALSIYNNELPEIVKIYIVSKKIEGLSQQTLDTYLRMLTLFFRDIRKAPAQITTNDIRVYLFRYQEQRNCSNRTLDNRLKSEIFGYFGDKPTNVFEDREISELVWDVLDLIHYYDYYVSGDTCKETYLKKKAEFKKKWLTNRGVRVRRIVDEALDEVRKELYETYNLSEEDPNEDNL